jgi:type III pantothenate kinase
MLLVMDVGNTNVVIGIFKGDQLIHQWRIATDRNKTEDEYGTLIKMFLRDEDISVEEIEAVIISSVVPPLNFALERMVKKYFKLKPMIVGPGIKTGLNIKYDNPKEIGADRIVNAVAAVAEYGNSLVIVDFGTATTFCLVNDEGNYLGGAICPGINISMEALYQNASKLPKVEFAKPESVVGRNTVMAMQSGLYYGYVGLVDGIANRMKQQLSKPGKVIATGGLAEYISKDSATIDIIDPHLTLKGLRIIYERNRS